MPFLLTLREWGEEILAKHECQPHPGVKITGVVRWTDRHKIRLPGAVRDHGAASRRGRIRFP